MKASGIPNSTRRDVLKVAGVAAALAVIPLTARIVVAADGGKMKIGIIGSGHVGSALGRAWAEAGHDVMFSSRNLDNDKKALEVASRLVREVGFEPVVVGGPEMGKYLMPGTPLAGEHSPDEVRRIAATLKP